MEGFSKFSHVAASMASMVILQIPKLSDTITHVNLCIKLHEVNGLRYNLKKVNYWRDVLISAKRHFL